MKILAVDTAANVASASITDGDKLVCEAFLNNKKTHSQTLMPMIESLFSQTDIKISDIDLFAVSDGPGSFTGLRIGISAVKGFAHALNKKIVGVSTLTAMAYNLPYCQYIIAPIMDARRGQVYSAVYEWENEKLKEHQPPMALSIDELLCELLKYEKNIVFLGDAVSVHKNTIIEKLGDKAVFAPSCLNEQRASTLAECAKLLYNEGKEKTCFELSPTYLRKPQAEREADEREKGQN